MLWSIISRHGKVWPGHNLLQWRIWKQPGLSCTKLSWQFLIFISKSSRRDIMRFAKLGPPNLDPTVVGKRGFWHNGSPTYMWGIHFWPPPPLLWSKFLRVLFVYVCVLDFFHTRKGKGEFFEFGPLKIWFLGFFTKIFNFWIFHQKGSKYSSFEIFRVNF